MNNIESPKGRILVVDDNEDVLLSLNMLLKPYVEAVRVTAKPERVIEFMVSFHPDVIILDMNFSRDAISGEEGYEWLARILEHDPKSVVLFITAYVVSQQSMILSFQDGFAKKKKLSLLKKDVMCRLLQRSII